LRVVVGAADEAAALGGVDGATDAVADGDADALAGVVVAGAALCPL
jgi:hypothetical protein